MIVVESLSRWLFTVLVGGEKASLSEDLPTKRTIPEIEGPDGGQGEWEGLW